MKRRNFLAAVSASLAFAPAHALAEGCSLEESASLLVSSIKLAKFSPRARSDLSAAILNNWSSAVAAGIATPLRVQHFLAQIATETGGFLRIDDNLNYSAAGLLKTFPSRISSDEAPRLARKPRQIANKVYGGRYGNTEIDDGWLYRGSGFIQLTFKDNYRDRGTQLGLDLVSNPELVRTPNTGFSAGVAYWSYARGNEKADADDLKSVRRAINGGLNGMDHAKIWIARAKKYFNELPSNLDEDDGPSADELDAVEGALKSLGLLESGLDESFDPQAVADALQKLRANYDLPLIDTAGLPAGAQILALYDEDLLYALTDPMSFRSASELSEK